MEEKKKREENPKITEQALNWQLERISNFLELQVIYRNEKSNVLISTFMFDHSFGHGC